METLNQQKVNLHALLTMDIHDNLLKETNMDNLNKGISHN